jgi:adenylate cyclase
MGEAERRLAGILAADVVGYSAMVGTDEHATLARVRSLRADIVEPLVAAHGGRLFKTTGDGFFAAFASAVQALRSAIAIQDRLRGQPDGLRLRIGVHQGEVVPEGDDLLGDGVIIAARLEPLAEPGGICISARVREDAAGKVALEADDLGRPELKNIATSIQVFRLRLDEGEHRAFSLSEKPPSVVLPVQRAQRELPSIAVLPFANMSGDPDQEFFADGLTEDILTALTRYAQLTVIARNSTFVYKGRAVSIADIARDLQVRYVLEGSVRRAGERVRVTAQLVEAATAAHLWAERYDRAMTDIFALQDEITERIVTTLVSNIERSIIEQARRKPPESFDAYELFLHGRELRNASRPDGFVAAEAQFERAVALDPGFASAHAEIAYIQYVFVTWRWESDRRDAQLSKGFVSARRALALEASLPLANRVLGMLHLRAREYAEAVTWTQRAVALNPGEAESYAWLANVLSFVGRSAEALEQLARATRLDPLHPPLWDFYAGRALLHLGRYDEALSSFETCLRRAPFFGHVQSYKSAALAHLGRLDEARAALPVPGSPGYYASIGDIRRWDSYMENIEFDRFIAGLRAAGLPD